MTQVEIHVLMDWKNQYHYNCPATQNNIESQCNPYQNMKGIFLRNRINDAKICMEAQKTPNNQDIIVTEKQICRYHAPTLERIL